jgi:hypothetical protein
VPAGFCVRYSCFVRGSFATRAVLLVIQPFAAHGAAVAREVFYCVRGCLFFSALPLLKKTVCN